MDKENILKKVDHTLLAQSATWEEIRQILDDAMKYETASACIPAAYVRQAAEYVEGKLPICTVIGFPNGYSTTAVKVFEAKDAIANGADEIDMVINIGALKDKRYEAVEDEIRQMHDACDGKILKVIIETCLLTEEEKIKMCEIVTSAGAEYIKTSTGFSSAGATFADVALMRAHVGKNVKVKAAGGIASFDDAQEFIRLGADRLGTSRLIKIMKNNETLIQEAKKAREHAHTPYSHFRVGAALLTKSGKVYHGCNIENAAYTPTNCAERTAFFKAVYDGEREFEKIAIVGGMEGTDGDELCAPCGVCLQVMMEFCDPETFQIILVNGRDSYVQLTLKELMPHGFGPENLN